MSARIPQREDGIKSFLSELRTKVADFASREIELQLEADVPRAFASSALPKSLAGIAAKPGDLSTLRQSASE